MRIGIIGTGISGLATGFLLGKAGHKVTLIDQQARIGIGAHSVSSSLFQNSEQAFDVPSRLCNSHHWPNLLELYASAGVEMADVAADQTYSDSKHSAYRKIDPQNLFSINPLSTGFSSLPRLYTELMRLRNSAEKDLVSGIGSDTSFEDYLDARGISAELKRGFLYPLLSSTVCTCSFEAVGRYPAKLILAILNDLNQSDSSDQARLQRTRFGTADVVERLLGFEPEVFLNRRVVSIETNEAKVRVNCRHEQASSSQSFDFDHIIVATQANHASCILPDHLVEEKQVLDQFKYEYVEVLVHSDKSLLPSRKKDWSTFNFSLNDSPSDATLSTCNIWLNKFYGWGESNSKDWFQAINPILPPCPDLCASHCSLQRPVIEERCFAAWDRLNALHLQTDRKIWFTGSYAAAGVPLLESGVVSAKSVVACVESAIGNAVN